MRLKNCYCYREMGIYKKQVLCIIFILFLAACAGTPIRSTVDGYGEIPVQKTEPHFFRRDVLSLQEKPVADSCKEAAVQAGINVSNNDCKDCRYVIVHSKVLATQDTLQASPAFIGGGVYGPRRLGYGYGGYETNQQLTNRDETGREIQIDIYQDQKLKIPMRSIAVRSVGEFGCSSCL